MLIINPLTLKILAGVATAGAATVAVKAATEKDKPFTGRLLAVKKKAMFKSVVKRVQAPNVPASKRPTGPLPAQALAAQNAKKTGKGRSRSAFKKGGPNDIHMRGAWFRPWTYSKKWDRKYDLMRWFANPPGTISVPSRNHLFNLAWMARAPYKLYPGYGKAAPRNVRWSALSQWLSPKAGWKTFTGMLADSLKAIPDIVKGAGVVGAAYASGGATAKEDPEGQIEAVENAIRSGLEPLGNVGDSRSKRKAAADVVISEVGHSYIEDLKAANPHIVMEDGSVNLGANYKPNPKTYEDLYDRSYQGKGHRPLLYNPA